MRSVFPVPGTRATLVYEHDEAGRLQRLSCGERVHVDELAGRRVYGDGLASVREVTLPGGLLRHVRAAGETWTEEYLWDEAGRPSRVDGVEVRRDADGRVVACGEWRYRYEGAALVAVERPGGVRRLERGREGRPARVREGGRSAALAYDAEGRRRRVPDAPAAWHRDALGRLWTVVADDGRVLATYLWDGFACLGRVDGPPDGPLAAVFSLDPTWTPVRVIGRDGVERVPRDLFGEALLAHEGVPGLHGGAVHRGFVHQARRVLDPRTGSYDRPDPLDGSDADPRRAEGYGGPLTVDAPAAGPYAVCGNDPLARVDPTGEMAVPVMQVLSMLTWSSQYMILNVVFLQLFVNFWFSLLGGNIGRWADMEGLSSARRGNFGFRFNPAGIMSFINLVAPGRQFTIHQVLWFESKTEGWDGLERVRVFAPDAAFRPTLYGTLLKAAPERAEPFLLRGSAHEAAGQVPARAQGWTRTGGVAEPVVPGSRVPWFPSGGLHFRPRFDDGALGSQVGRLVELQPVGDTSQGTVSDQTLVTIRKTGLGLAAGAKLHVEDVTGAGAISDVRTATEASGKTRVRLADDAHGVTPGPVRVRSLTAVGRENLNASATLADHLDARAPASTVRYAATHLLRLTAAGRSATVRIASLEAQLTLADPLPPTMRGPLEVYRAEPGGAFAPVTRDDPSHLTFPAGQSVPAAGDALLVRSGATTVVAVAIEATGDRQRRLAAPLDAALADPLEWRPLAPGASLGRRAGGPEATAQLTYTPVVSGQLNPAPAFVLVRGTDDSVAARAVSAVAYDDLVLPTATVAAGSGAYDVERFTFGGLDEKEQTLEPIRVLTLSAPRDLAGKPLELHQLAAAAPALAGGPLLANVPYAANVATVELPASAAAFTAGLGATRMPTPGQLLALDDAGTVKTALVKAVRVTAQLDRTLTIGGGAAKLEAVPLAPAGPRYVADSLGPLAVVVRPTARLTPGPGTAAVELPRFAEGELVEVSFGAAPDRRRYRVAHADGTKLTLAGDADLPAAVPDLTVQRLAALDPATGGTRLGREGTLRPAAAGGQSVVRLDVWHPSALSAGAVVGLAEAGGAETWPAAVAALQRVEVELHPFAAGATVSLGPLDLAGDPVHVAAATQEGDDILLPGPQPPGYPGERAPAFEPHLVSGPRPVLVVPWQETPLAAAGRFEAGTVLVPEDPEHSELSHKQAMIDHELMHAEQFARWGPIMLSPLPFRMLVDILDATVTSSSDTVKTTGRVLRDIGTVLTLGGLMRLFEESLVGGVAWVLFKFFFFWERLFTGQPLSAGWFSHADWLSFHDATVPDAAQPQRVHVDGLTLAKDDVVEVTDGSTFSRATVTAVGDADVDLDRAPPASGLKIAKVAAADPVNEASDFVLNQSGFGRLRDFFDFAIDPWSQIEERGQPKPGSFWDVAAKVARELFGSESWALPMLGYFLWDDALRNAKAKGHLSKMEQEASEESGELYSPLGRLRGQLDVVGDVARYWYVTGWRHRHVLEEERQDAPGVHLAREPRVLPRSAATGAPGAVNGAVEAAADATLPGADVADLFVVKDPGNPDAVPVPAGAPTPRGFAPSDRGTVPAGGKLERASGAYIAFTRPGTHRVTVRNDIFQGADAAEAQAAGKQTIFFDKTVADVEVRALGAALAEGATLRLVQTQRAAIRVSPNGSRRYGASLLRPTEGLSLRLDTGDPLVVVAQRTNGVEPVQLDRVYRYDGTRFDSEALQTHGLHLPEDVRIAVRRLFVEVTDRLDVRAHPLHADAPLAVPAKPGDTVYVLVPAHVVRLLAVTSVAYRGIARPATATDPDPEVGLEPTPAGESDFLGDGVVFKIAFGPDDPPEEPLDLTLAADVGTPGTTATLTALAQLDPHFRLTAASYTVARGGRVVLHCDGAATAGAVTIVPPAHAEATGVTATAAGADVTVDVAAGAAVGRWQIRVADGADAAHRARRTIEVT